MSDFPYLFICYLKPGKGTPFGRKLPEKAIIWVITCDQAIFFGGGGGRRKKKQSPDCRLTARGKG